METDEKDKKKADRKAYKKEYYLKNAESIKLWRKEYYLKNSETIKAKMRGYWTKNSEDIKTKHKEYCSKNSDILKMRRKEYIRTRFKIDPYFKMVEILRNRIRSALKSQGTKKSTNSMDLLGASKEDVWKHLELQFKEGMTRENHGSKGWHLDHIRPCSSFDLSDPEEQKKCFHYTNLQPLWWWENLEKSDKII